MKGIYLAACIARHPNYDIVYNDIDKKYGCDIVCDMLDVDLTPYDFIIASPPCNYYSRMNYRRNISKYALMTKHLLPDILVKLSLLGKPFIVENVRNFGLFYNEGIISIADRFNLNVYYIGRHTYFTNVSCNLECDQHFDFNYGSKRVNNDGYNQGGSNVHVVIEIWLNQIVNNKVNGTVQTNIFDFM